MAVTLRLARFGKKATPRYRIVVSEKGSKRDGRFLERLGTYTPITDPATIVLKEDRVRHWIGLGAQITPAIRKIVRKQVPGFIEDLEKRRTEKKQKARAARKARAKKNEAKK